jgi:hypothetical protein
MLPSSWHPHTVIQLLPENVRHARPLNHYVEQFTIKMSVYNFLISNEKYLAVQCLLMNGAA